MFDIRRAILAAAVAAASALSAHATAIYSGVGRTDSGLAYVAHLDGTPFDTLLGIGCIGSTVCYNTGIGASIDGIGASYAQHGIGLYPAAGAGSSTVTARGEITLIYGSHGPAFIDTVLTLDLEGYTLPHAEGISVASGGVSVRVPEFGAVMIEYAAANVAPPANVYINVERSPGKLLVPIHVPVNVPFSLSLELVAFGSAVGAGGESFILSEWLHTLTLARGGAVFDLPDGYSAQSDDWGIDRNRFCPHGCAAAVPAPGTLALSLFGVALAVGASRRGLFRTGSSAAPSAAAWPARR